MPAHSDDGRLSPAATTMTEPALAASGQKVSAVIEEQKPTMPENDLTTKLVSLPDCTTHTVYDVFVHGFVTDRQACLAWKIPNERRFQIINFGEAHRRTQGICRAIGNAGVRRQECVGIYASSSHNWALAAMACAAGSFIIVPLYDTLGADSSFSIIEEVGMSLLFVDTFSAAERIVSIIADKQFPTSIKLTTIVIFDERKPEEAAKMAKEANKWSKFRVLSFEDFHIEDNIALRAAEAEDLYMIQYTSGTTGRPKGVMLTHSAFVASVAGLNSLFVDENGNPEYNGSDSILEYLPLAHSYGQMVLLYGFYVGACVGFYGGNIAKLLEDAEIFRPTWLPLVPRLMNKFYSRVTEEVAKSRVKSALFWFAYDQKRRLLQQGITTTSTIWDKIVFQKLRDKLGGRVRGMLSTSAPISSEVLEFWRIVFGCTITNGWGQTEAVALVTGQRSPCRDDVGPAVVSAAVKLVDVPDMGYYATERRGEICVKGPIIMKGYFNQPEKTAEAIDTNGWLHTGDIAQMLDDGSLKIIDRKKHIFKLSQGEYIAPEKIEQIYSCSPYVAQVYVDGNSLQWFTVGVVVPDPIEAEKWWTMHRSNNNGATFLMTDICKDNDFINCVMQSLLALGKRRGLNQLEQIKSLYLHPDAFSVTNELMTPSMKNRRPQLREYFRAKLDEMYAKGPMTFGADKAANGQATH